MTLEDEIIQTKPFKTEFHKLSVNLLFTGSWIHNRMSKYLKTFDVSLEQYNVLRILNGQNKNPLTIKEISRRMLEKNSNVSRLIDKLIEKGFAKKEINEKIKREVCIIISDQGKTRLEIIDKSGYLDFGFLTHLSQEEAVKLNKLLDKCRDNPSN